MSFLVPNIFDIFDIGIMAIIIYQLMSRIHRSGARYILVLAAVVYIIYAFSSIFRLEMMASVFKLLRDYWIIIILIIFQPEIRHFVMSTGQSNSIRYFFMPRKQLFHASILEAVTSMSFKRTGALIVLENRQQLDALIGSGEIIDAEISTKLLLTIFNTKTILHDGAVVIRGNRIYAVKVVLPLSKSIENTQKFGTRHLAGIGVTENSDATSIIVSEETGKISLARDGKIIVGLSKEELAQQISDATKQ